MNLSRPIIAAIVTGGIVVVTLVVLLILHLTGFFGPDEVVTTDKSNEEVSKGETPSTEENGPLKEIRTAADALLPLFGGERSKFEKLLKTLSFEKVTECDDLEEWISGKLPAILTNDETAAEKVVNYITLSSYYLLEKALSS